MSFTINGSSGITFPDTTTQTTAATASVPAGAITNFVNAAAPTGWTKVTTYNDYALRIVSGTGAGTGGSVAFTTAFASQAVSGTSGATTLDISQIPSHSHSMPVLNSQGGSGISCGYSTVAGSPSTNATGGGGSHTHSFSGTAINLAVNYVDSILCQKN